MVRILWSKQLGLTLAGVALGMAGWFVMLGGLASLSTECSDAMGKTAASGVNSVTARSAL